MYPMMKFEPLSLYDIAHPEILEHRSAILNLEMETSVEAAAQRLEAAYLKRCLEFPEILLPDTVVITIE
jgi:hypothetical protein